MNSEGVVVVVVDMVGCRWVVGREGVVRRWIRDSVADGWGGMVPCCSGLRKEGWVDL